jgi:hypothetical protein
VSAESEEKSEESDRSRSHSRSDFVHEHTQISNEFLEDLELIEELRQFIEPKDLPESQDTVKQVREN